MLRVLALVVSVLLTAPTFACSPTPARNACRRTLRHSGRRSSGRSRKPSASAERRV